MVVYTVYNQKISPRMSNSLACQNPNPMCNTHQNPASAQSNSATLFPQHGRMGSSSDEDPHQQQHQNLMDEKKQKRMMSNRESARRSRMKKQQHLDDLQAQASQLRAENSVLLNRFNIANQNYMTIEEQNRVLRALVVDLSAKLEALQSVLEQQAGGLKEATGPMASAAFSHYGVSDFSPMVGGLDMEKVWLPHLRQTFKEREIHH